MTLDNLDMDFEGVFDLEAFSSRATFSFVHDSSTIFSVIIVFVTCLGVVLTCKDVVL